jgi:hypothetical protein
VAYTCILSQEAEIRRIRVRSQREQIVPQDPISKKPIKKRAGGVCLPSKGKALNSNLSIKKKMCIHNSLIRKLHELEKDHISISYNTEHGLRNVLT